MRRLGISINAGAVRAVLVSARSVMWAGEANLSDGSVEEQVRFLLDAVPCRWPARPRVRLSLGAERSQLKRLERLPNSDDRALLGRVVASNPRAFFVGSAPVRVSDVEMVSPGIAWAAVFDEASVAAVERACAAAGFKLELVTTSAWVAGSGLGSSAWTWPDVESAFDVTWVDGAPATVRRRKLSGAKPPEPPLASAELGGLEPNAFRFADAYGACLLTRRSGIQFRGRGQRGARRKLGTRALAGLLLLAGAVGSAGAIAYESWKDGSAIAVAERQIEELAEARAVALETYHQLLEVSSALEFLGNWDTRRGSILRLLAALVEHLPEGSAIASIRVEPERVHLTMVATSARAVLESLQSMPEVEMVQLVGPISRERRGSREFERLSVSFSPRGDVSGQEGDA